MGKLKERLLKREKDMVEERWPELKLLKEDPIKWELLYYRFLGMVAEGRETARMISASPTVREFGECVFGLFNPEGESIAFSRGILLHMASMGSSVKWMLKNDYEEVVGIKEGDIFYNNDPDIGGAHSADQAVLLPIFYKGELVAWIGGLTHCMEVGSTEPGGISPSAISRYDDGQMVPCMKVGVNNQFNPDFHIMVSRNVRDGRWWILDDRAKLAGCLRMKDSLFEAIESVGIDYFERACYEMIESGRQFAVNKFKTVFFPGRYRSAGFYDVCNASQPVRIPIDQLIITPCEMNIHKDGRLDIDYDGSSSSGYHSNNSSFACTLGNHVFTFIQDCLYDGFFNQGLVYSINLNVPRGSCLNPEIDKACCMWQTACQAMAACVTPSLSHAYFAKGFREEGMAGKAQTSAMFAGGIDRDGQRFAGLNFEANTSGSPAQCSHDGLHAANAVWNPEVNMSDCETFEHIWPLMWLGRGLWKDGGGYGKHRGGSGVESLYVIEHEPLHIESGSVGSGDGVFTAPGLFGGYPAPSRYRYCYIKTNYREVVQKQMPLPHREGDDPTNPDFVKLMKGELLRTPGQSASRLFGNYDLIHQETGGGGGWGDPLDRPVEEIEKDLVDEIISERTARVVYCVAIDPETKKIDPEKTRELREAARKTRLRSGIPVEEFIKAQREKILRKDISEICKRTYNDCFKNSSKFLREFKECWGLPEEFEGF
jgi:acetone carboxylase alpha subunit